MKKMFFGLMFGVAVCTLSPSYAMDEVPTGQGQLRVVIPEEFPGHNARPIQGAVWVANEFDPKHYQQDKRRGEGACRFNSMLAGLMHTEHGRAKVQAIIKSQDENYVNIHFYFPDSAILKKYDYTYKSFVESGPAELEELQNSIGAAETEEDRLYWEAEEEAVKSQLVEAPLLWAKVLGLPQTTVRVPKKFVSREDRGSFPHNNPEWLNIVQQAYMKVTKNKNFTTYSTGGYSSDGSISESDRFTGIPFCTLYQGVYKDTPNYTNLIGDSSIQPLQFFPLINIPLKSIEILLNEEGLDLSSIKDFKAERQAESFTYTPLSYAHIVDFVHTHGLSKDLLMNSNVVQFNSRGHSVALFFGKGKVHYFDNVHYLPQVAVYGVEGPVYEEAKYFKDQDLTAMNEEEFFTRLFKEIPYRLKQVTDVRGESPMSQTTILFFERPLAD